MEHLPVGGSVAAGAFTTTLITPTAANHLASKSYVDASKNAAIAAIALALTAALNGLHRHTRPLTQSISHRSVNGVTIGGTTRAAGSFTQVNTDAAAAATVWSISRTGGYANSGLVLRSTTATDPAFRWYPMSTALLLRMSGGQATFRAHSNGRTVVGAGIRLNTLQVYGDSVPHGRTTFDGGTMTGSATAIPNATVWTLASSTPI